MSELVSQSDNVFSQAIGAQAALFYYYHADEAPEVELRAEALLQLAQNLDLPFFIGIAKVFLAGPLADRDSLNWVWPCWPMATTTGWPNRGIVWGTHCIAVWRLS
ncbi:hypothetical protein N779_21180 [Vibrio coralliilyticus OCN008]|nr:hypothetical protein N779_21180 [Vibrio coralliilyticus OCN008]